MRVFDTNILISVLNEHKGAQDLLVESLLTSQIGASIISVTEILSGVTKREHAKVLNAFSDVSILPFDTAETASLAGSYRHEYKLRTPDAIILATCEYGNHQFYTYDRDFKKLKRRWIHILNYDDGTRGN